MGTLAKLVKKEKEVRLSPLIYQNEWLSDKIMTASQNQINLIYDLVRSWDLPTRGIDRGIQWEINRPYGTYWCGYIKVRVTESTFEAVERVAHGPINYRHRGWIGFNCNQVGDYNGIYSLRGDREGYRNYDYVLKVIRDMIKVAIASKERY